MRQLADEADRVGEQHQLVDPEFEPPGFGVERREEAVLGVGASLGAERVHQRRFASVGVADQRHARHGGAATGLGVVLERDGAELLLERGDAVAHEAAVGLDLRFAGAFGADAALLLRQVRPRAGEPWQQIFELREFHLHLGLRRFCADGENLQNEAGAVDHLALEDAFEISHLHGREVVVENHDIDLVGFDQSG